MFTFSLSICFVNRTMSAHCIAILTRPDGTEEVFESDSSSAECLLTMAKTLKLITEEDASALSDPLSDRDDFDKLEERIKQTGCTIKWDCQCNHDHMEYFPATRNGMIAANYCNDCGATFLDW